MFSMSDSPEEAVMASNSSSEQAFDTRALWRLATWGASAVVALSLAIVVGTSDLGARRLAAKPAAGGQETVQKSAPIMQIAARSAEVEAETRRLAESVRLLISDRDRLVARIGVLERNFEDFTGSTRRQGALPTPAKEAPPAEKQSAVAPAATSVPTPGPAVVIPEAGTSAVNTPAPATAVTPPSRGPVVTTLPGAVEPRATALQPAGDLPLPVVAKTDSEPPVTELGVDIGGAVSFDGLRALWVSTKSQHVGLLDDLHPVVAVRENTRSKSPDLRLIVGPVENAEAAARICAKLSATRRYCQPVAFQGQRLARADVVLVPERKPAAPAPKQVPPPPAVAPPSSTLPWLFR
jgi:hypothetical protein